MPQLNRVVPVLLAAGVLTGCVGASHGQVLPFGPPGSVPTVVLVVEYAGSDLPGAPKGNHPTPRQVARVTNAIKCRMWVTNPLNFGGMVNGEVHVQVDTSDAAAATRKVRALPGVTSVRVVSPNQFGDIPALPTDAPHRSFLCRNQY